MSDVFAEACRTLIDDGDCVVECCGPIPMLRSLVKKHHDLIAVDYTDTIPDHPEFTFPVTCDLMCIFLDGVSKQCSIYPDRPDVCRKFGDESHVEMSCPYLRSDGTKRNRQSRRKIQRAGAAAQERSNAWLSRQRNSMMAN